VSNYVRDSIGPILQAFSLDFDANELVLTFNEPVLSSTLDIPQITFSAFANFSATNYSLTEGEIEFFSISTGVLQFRILLSRNDIRELKVSKVLATSRFDTFLSLALSAVQDTSHSPNLAIYFQRVSRFILDTTPAEIEYFSLDLDLGILSLTFNDVMDISSLNLNGIQLQNSNYSGDSNRPQLMDFDLDINSSLIILYFNEAIDITTLRTDRLRLSAGNRSSIFLQFDDLNTSSYINITTLQIPLPIEFTNVIKLNPSLATSVNNTFLSLTNETVEDFASNLLLPIGTVNPKQVRLYLPDTVQPVLIQFEFDNNQGTLLLLFSETIDASSLNVQMITLQNSENVRSTLLNELYSLTNSTHSQENSNIISIYLSTFDSNNIKALTGLAVSINTTYISTGTALVEDMSAVIAKPISQNFALSAAIFVGDSTRPQLSHAVLNLTSETIKVYVSETIRVESVNLSHFSLHSASRRQIFLSGGTVSNVNAPVFSITLETFDIYLLQQDQNFATNLTNVFFSFTEQFLSDMTNNPIIPINASNPIMFSAFISDVISPTLISFSFDLNNGTLILTFSETVRGLTVPFCDIILKNSDSSRTFPISNFSIDSDINSPSIQIFLSRIDLNLIKSSIIGASSFFIFMPQCNITDMASNNFTPLGEENALESTRIFPDITSPQLLSFILNLNSSKVFSYIQIPFLVQL
ncbi:hypothetical protein LOD99_10289, partial [Oopsacas minuta]